MSLINWLLLLIGDAAQWFWHDGLESLGTLCGGLSDLANPVLAPLFRGLNVAANAVGGVLFAPIGWLPGWLSNTLISAVTGVLLLLIFKYTSRQKAIGRIKDEIKANLLALKLFKDELSVVFSSQGRVFWGAVRLLGQSVRPLLVMLIPVSLELAQMGLWYQGRPLAPDEETLVTLQLAGHAQEKMPTVEIEPGPGAEIVVGPFRKRATREVLCRIKARAPGRHELVFQIGGKKFTKELVVRDVNESAPGSRQRVSACRPAWNWTAMILHPAEPPFRADSIVQSIAIDYPERSSLTSGTDAWVIYFFVASMVFALLFKPFLKVKI